MQVSSEHMTLFSSSPVNLSLSPYYRTSVS